MEEMRKSGMDRKTLFVGVVITLLFISGIALALGNSGLRPAVGQLVYDFPAPEDKHIFKENEPRDDQAQQEENLFHEEPAVPEQEPEENSSVIQTNQQVVWRHDAAGMFGTKSLRVIAPNGGETFCVGDSIVISWEQQGVEMIRAVLYEEGKQSYELGVFSGQGAGAKNSVNVQPAPGTQYVVRLMDAADSDVKDESDSPFTIARCGE